MALAITPYETLFRNPCHLVPFPRPRPIGAGPLPHYADARAFFVGEHSAFDEGQYPVDPDWLEQVRSAEVETRRVYRLVRRQYRAAVGPWWVTCWRRLIGG